MLILASSSPRRHELLLAAGIPHIVRGANIDEARLPGEGPLALVQRLAEEKARATPHGRFDIVLGADTIVCVESEVLGKPIDDADARHMLRLLSGRSHFVHTGICLLAGEQTIRDIATTQVSFALLTEDEIEEYTRSGETRDKAGSYAVQGIASRFVTELKGCYHNVVGLPVSLVYSHLKTL